MTGSRGLRWHYGVLGFPLAFAGYPLYMLAPDFYAVTHGVSLSTLGVLLLLLRLFDGVQDPIIGWLIDRFSAHFKWVLIGGGAVMWGGMTMLFNTLWGDASGWFLMWMGVAVSGYSVMGIGLGAWATWWAHDATEQTQLTTFREGWGLLGVIMGVSVPTVLAMMVPTDQVYRWASAVWLLCLGAAWVGVRYLPSPPLASTGGRVVPSLWQGIQEMSGRTWSILGASLLSMLASSIPAVLVIFFVRDRLGHSAFLPLFLLLYFVSGALGMPVWQSVAARWGPARAWALAHGVACLCFVWAFFLGSGDGLAFAAVCVCSGVALGADLSMPPVLLANQTHLEGHHDRAGAQYAWLVLVGKLALALASVVALPLLGAAGFVTNGENTPEALMALSVGYALLPCLIKGCAGWWVWRFADHSDSRASKKPIVLKG